MTPAVPWGKALIQSLKDSTHFPVPHHVAARRRFIRACLDAGNPPALIRYLLTDFPELAPEFPELARRIEPAPVDATTPATCAATGRSQGDA